MDRNRGGLGSELIVSGWVRTEISGTDPMEDGCEEVYTMAGCINLADMEEASLELIDCPSQPGRLRISRHACARRYLMAKKGGRPLPNDEFGMAFKAGLEICRRCSEGRVSAEALDRA